MPAFLLAGNSSKAPSPRGLNRLHADAAGLVTDAERRPRANNIASFVGGVSHNSHNHFNLVSTT